MKTFVWLQLQLSEVIMRARNFVTELLGGQGNVLGHHMTQEMLEKKLYDAGIKDTQKFLEKVVTDSQGWAKWWSVTLYMLQFFLVFIYT